MAKVQPEEKNVINTRVEDARISPFFVTGRAEGAEDFAHPLPPLGRISPALCYGGKKYWYTPAIYWLLRK